MRSADSADSAAASVRPRPPSATSSARPLRSVASARVVPRHGGATGDGDNLGQRGNGGPSRPTTAPTQRYRRASTSVVSVRAGWNSADDGSVAVVEGDVLGVGVGMAQLFAYARPSSLQGAGGTSPHSASRARSRGAGHGVGGVVTPHPPSVASATANSNAACPPQNGGEGIQLARKESRKEFISRLAAPKGTQRTANASRSSIAPRSSGGGAAQREGERSSSLSAQKRPQTGAVCVGGKGKRRSAAHRVGADDVFGFLFPMAPPTARRRAAYEAEARRLGLMPNEEAPPSAVGVTD